MVKGDAKGGWVEHHCHTQELGLSTVDQTETLRGSS